MVHNWKMRWVMLQAGCVWYFAEQSRRTQLGVMPLLGSSVEGATAANPRHLQLISAERTLHLIAVRRPPRWELTRTHAIHRHSRSAACVHPGPADSPVGAAAHAFAPPHPSPAPPPEQADQTEALGWLRVLKRAIEEVNQRSVCEEGARGPLLVAGFEQLLSPLLVVKS